MGTIERLKSSDFEEAMDFLSMVFKDDNFENLHPKLYQPTDEKMSCNLAIKKDGRIRAIVGLFPMEVQAGSRLLKVGGIGGVSTHPKYRNKGFMKMLMEECIRVMKSEGFHASCLVGLRQRYGYYGYEKAGGFIKYYVTRTNVHHVFGHTRRGANISFEQMNKNDLDRLSRARRLYYDQPFHCIRDEHEFYLFLKTWRMVPWAVLDSDGNFLGYIVSDQSKNDIKEIFVEDSIHLTDILNEWINKNNIYDVNVYVPQWKLEYSRILGSVCEYAVMEDAYNWQIFNWTEVLNALFEVRVESGMGYLAEGEMDIEIKGHGTINIKAKDNLAVCSQTSASPQLSVGQLEAIRLFLGCLPAQQVLDIPEKLSPLVSSWFPLPFGWFSQDGI